MNLSLDQTKTSPEEHLRYLHLLVCPRCGNRPVQQQGALKCESCGVAFPIQNGIPLMFAPTDPGMFKRDVTDMVRAFYEETPFPNYEDTDNVGSLIEKARKGLFAHLLDQQLPFGIRVLECGCGTGQLSNFLGIAHRTVFGTDICLNSLGLAQNFKQKNHLKNVHFIQMNLFRPVFPEASFDVVISNGVLHSTSDTYLGFSTLARLVKPGGYLIIGLYHTYGRLLTDLRRLAFRVTGNRLLFLDPRLKGLGQARRSAWFADQYKHPHELKYTIGDILPWLEPNKLRLVKSIPKTRLGSRFSKDEKLFESEPAGRKIERGLIEMAMTFTGHQEGGFFTVISQRVQ